MPDLTASLNVILRTFKRANGNPAYIWSNSYEAHVTAPLTAAQWTEILDILVGREQPLHLTNVQFVQANASTYLPDSHPYNPLAFLTRPVSGTQGTRSPSGIGTELPRNVALHVKRDVALGRAGKLFYRGALDEADVATDTGLQWRLLAGPALAAQGAVSDLFDAVQGALVSAGGAGSSLSLISGVVGTPGIRPVIALVVRGVNVVSADHRFFDRAA